MECLTRFFQDTLGFWVETEPLWMEEVGTWRWAEWASGTRQRRRTQTIKTKTKQLSRTQASPALSLRFSRGNTYVDTTAGTVVGCAVQRHPRHHTAVPPSPRPGPRAPSSWPPHTGSTSPASLPWCPLIYLLSLQTRRPSVTRVNEIKQRLSFRHDRRRRWRCGDGFGAPDVRNMEDPGVGLFENAGEVATFLCNRRGG